MDKREINLVLSSLKTENGHYNFPAILSIKERLPQMAKSDPTGTVAAIAVALTMAFESMNLVRPMNESQILDLADAIIDSSSEDYLSLEDLVLFLQGLTRGKYGPLYESMDIPKFMEKFELYRQERHTAYMDIKYEQESNFKSLGTMERTNQPDPLSDHFSRMADRISGLKDALKYEQEVNRANRL